jgi:hypothetical protein
VVLDDHESSLANILARLWPVGIPAALIRQPGLR